MVEGTIAPYATVYHDVNQILIIFIHYFRVGIISINSPGNVVLEHRMTQLLHQRLNNPVIRYPQSNGVFFCTILGTCLLAGKIKV